MRSSWGHFDGGSSLPQFVIKAVHDGWELEHHTILARCPKLSPARGPLISNIFQGLEAVFCGIFWTMLAGRYVLDELRSRLLEDYEWNGLYSHSSLTERCHTCKVYLSEEGLEAITAAGKARKAAYMKAYQPAYIKKRITSKTEADRERQRQSKKKQRPKRKERMAEAKAMKIFCCDACSATCRDASRL